MLHVCLKLSGFQPQKGGTPSLAVVVRDLVKFCFTKYSCPPQRWVFSIIWYCRLKFVRGKLNGDVFWRQSHVNEKRSHTASVGELRIRRNLACEHLNFAVLWFSVLKTARLSTESCADPCREASSGIEGHSVSPYTSDAMLAYIWITLTEPGLGLLCRGLMTLRA